MSQPEPREDDWRDLLGKAARGRSARDLLKQLPPPGNLPGDDVLRQLASALGLHPERLVNLAHHPKLAPPSLPAGVWFNQDEIPGETVRRSLIWDAATHAAALFDTGFHAAEILEFAGRHQLQVTDLFLTHSHHDHVEALPDLLRFLPHPVRVHIGEGEPGVPQAIRFTPGAVFNVGTLRVETRPTPGHSPGGVTYVVSGLAVPVAVVGDAFFAGSLGYPPGAWEPALEAIRRHILSLPPETVLLPGHGPATTVATELATHPLFGW